MKIRTIAVLCYLGTLAVSAHAERSFYYYYYGEKRELKSDPEFIAILPAELPGESAALRHQKIKQSLSLEDRDIGSVEGPWIIARSKPLHAKFASDPRVALERGLCDLVALDSNVELVSPVFSDSRGRPVFLTDEIVVVPGKNAWKETKTKHKLASSEDRELFSGRMRIVKHAHKNAARALDLANVLCESGEVVCAEPAFVLTATASLVPTDSRYPQSWFLNNTGSSSNHPYGGPSLADIDLNAPQAWDFTTGSPTVKVLLMDSGVYFANTAFTSTGIGATFADGGPGYGPGQPEVAPGTSVPADHGTRLAGLISGKIDNNGTFRPTVGIAPNVDVISARIGRNYRMQGGSILFTTNTAWWASALSWGQSMGASVSCNANYLYFESTAIALAMDLTQGMETRSIYTSPVSGAVNASTMLHFSVAGSYYDAGVLPFPANLSSVVAVAGVYANGQLAFNQPLSAGQKPWFVAPGHALWTTSYDQWNSSEIVYGNSAACALAAGCAALIKSQNPSWPASAVLYRMKQTARDLGAYGVDSTYGYGMPDPYRALQNNAADGLWDLVNVSTRSYVGTGDNVAIQGFVISGSNSKRVLLRAVGPSLSAWVPGTLADPVLMLLNQSGQPIYTSDDWQSQPDAGEIQSVGSAYGAFQLSDSRDSALLVTLNPGIYTAIASGKNSTSGIAMIEAYDVDPNASSGKFANLSTRAYVGTGDGITIPGIVIQANAIKRVLIRAVGPTLGQLGVGGVISDPQITLIRSDTGQQEAYNNNWNGAPNVAEIRAATAQVGAFALTENNADAAILVGLPGGIYTAHISGVGGTTGIVLFEAYVVD